jgi:hypothetical protein
MNEQGGFSSGLPAAGMRRVSPFVKCNPQVLSYNVRGGMGNAGMAMSKEFGRRHTRSIPFRMGSQGEEEVLLARV